MDIKIKMKKNGNELTVQAAGRLDAITSPELDRMLETSYKGIEKLIIDLGKLEFISSAGLRVLLGASQTMEQQGGEMIVRNLTTPVRNVMEIVGFDSAINIE